MPSSPREPAKRSLPLRTGTWSFVVLFSLTSLGLPVEEWVSAVVSGTQPTESSCALVPGTSCQCSPARRKSGRCCCQLAHKTKTKSCCAPRTDVIAKSCCTKSKPIAAEKSSVPIVSSCGCSEGESLGLLWSGEPRLKTIPVTLSFSTETSATVVWCDDAPSGLRSRPDVPPPRDRLLSV